MYRCSACLVGFRWPQPSEEELSELYQQAESDQWTYTPSARPDWVLASRALRDSGAVRVLDVGCFDGGFLLNLPKTVERYGVELSRPAAARAEAQGVSILAPTLNQLGNSEVFDAVLAFDVIEHVGQPEALLYEMASRTRVGGAVIISTGNLDSASWRFMGSAYWYSSLPEHLSFTSPGWAKRAGALCGLELESVQRFSHATSRAAPLRVLETVKNAIYRTSPKFFARLRSWGLGQVDVMGRGSLAETPPIWITARDQYMAVFRRSTDVQNRN